MGKFGSILSQHAMTMDRKKLNSMSYGDRKEAIFGGLADKMMAQRSTFDRERYLESDKDTRKQMLLDNFKSTYLPSGMMPKTEGQMNVNNKPEMKGSVLKNTLFRR